MIVKKHVSNGKLLLAICDKEIIGKKYSEGEIELDLASDFYSGEEMDKEAVQELMKSSYIVNLCGEKSLACAKELGVVDDSNVILVEGIPHAQVIFILPEN